MTGLIGTTLRSRYQIIKELGRGGYGQVFLAYDLQLQRQVAVKRLHPSGLPAVAQARFKREIQALARLNHPHIIEIYDVIEEDGLLYHVMPYSQAGSLANLLDQPDSRRGMPVEEVIEIAKALTSALKTVHDQGIIHRDIKPSNILLSDSKDGWVVKLADFGVAHLPGDSSQPDGTQLTQAGDILGTLAYLAPEQLLGVASHPQSDVYSLAALLYQLLAGRHYLALDSDDYENRRRILNNEPQPLSQVRPDVPAWLETLIGQALSKKPQGRPTAAQFHQFLETGGQPGNRPTKSRVRPVPSIRPGQRSAAQLLSLFSLVLVTAIISTGLTVLFTAYQGPVLSSSDLAVMLEQAQAYAGEELAGESYVTAVVQNTAPAQGLKLRTGPALTAEVVGILADGAIVDIIEFNPDETWARIESDLGTGWVYTAYLRPIEEK